MRENGYYKVKRWEIWEVARWDDGVWWFVGDECELIEKYLEKYGVTEIGEKVL